MIAKIMQTCTVAKNLTCVLLVNPGCFFFIDFVPCSQIKLSFARFLPEKLARTCEKTGSGKLRGFRTGLIDSFYYRIIPEGTVIYCARAAFFPD